VLTGVYPKHEKNRPQKWAACARQYVENHGLKGACFIKAEGPSVNHPEINPKMEIIEL